MGVLSKALKENESLKRLNLRNMQKVEEKMYGLLIDGITSSRSVREVQVSVQNNYSDFCFKKLIELMEKTTSIQRIVVNIEKSKHFDLKLEYFETTYQALLRNESIQQLKVEKIDKIISRVAYPMQQDMLRMLLKIRNLLQSHQKDDLQLSRSIRRTNSFNTNFTKQKKFTYRLDGYKVDSSIDFLRMGLSIDGGGIRGLLPATIIDYLSKETKRAPHEMFDQMGGTSIGGIMALTYTGTMDGVNPV